MHLISPFGQPSTQITLLTILREALHMARCIYCRCELNSNVPADDFTGTLEHILPLALGGSAAFATPDASKKYNNDFGSSIDARFADQLPLAIKRHKFRIPGQSGKVPPIALKARSEDNGEPLTIEFGIDGTLNVIFPPTVIDDQKRSHLARLVAGSPENVREILAGMLKKAQRSGQSIYMEDGSKIARASDFEEFFQV